MEHLLFWKTKIDLKNVYFLGTLKNSWGGEFGKRTDFLQFSGMNA